MFWLYIGEGVDEVPLIYGSCSTPEALFTSRVFMGVGVDILDPGKFSIVRLLLRVWKG
jgi:hypothetical protein